MSKIGILTFHHPSNFGANLQAYSNYLYLTSLGHTVKIIDYIRKTDLQYSGKVCGEQFECHAQFVKSHLPLTRTATTISELQAVVLEEKFDIIAIGADAVWTKSSNSDFVFFAKWIRDDERLCDVKVVSISAACMDTSYSKEDFRVIENCFNRFSSITVRDVFTKQFVEQCTNRNDVIINPDPVFLLSSMLQDDWRPDGILEDRKYILMTLDRDWVHPKQTQWFNQFKKAINTKGYQLVELPLPEGVSGQNFDYTIPYPIDPIQWFQTIRHARGFIGLRFHSVVSCFSCGVPFISLDTYGFRSPIINRLKYNFKLYPVIQPFEKMSKIRNLLKGSGFESCRLSTNPIVIPADIMADKLFKINTIDIVKFRDMQIELFQKNVRTILK